MKTENTKSWRHEFGYVVLITLALVILSVTVFPLFIAMWPAAILVGCVSIWHLDHLNNKKAQ
jgi:hypothetical protein